METKVTKSSAADAQVMDIQSSECLSDVIFECPQWLDDILDM